MGHADTPFARITWPLFALGDLSAILHEVRALVWARASVKGASHRFFAPLNPTFKQQSTLGQNAAVHLGGETQGYR